MPACNSCITSRRTFTILYFTMKCPAKFQNVQWRTGCSPVKMSSKAQNEFRVLWDSFWILYRRLNLPALNWKVLVRAGWECNLSHQRCCRLFTVSNYFSPDSPDSRIKKNPNFLEFFNDSSDTLWLRYWMSNLFNWLSRESLPPKAHNRWDRKIAHQMCLYLHVSAHCHAPEEWGLQ